MAYDFDVAGLINEVILPTIEDSRFVKPYRDLAGQFNEDSTNPGGDVITHQILTSTTSNARNFTKADVDPVAGSMDAVVAKWNFTYQETAAEVFNIDINQAAGEGLKGIENLLTFSIAREMDGLWSLIYDNVYAQIKADLTTAGTYSDQALSRVTYPTLALYNELTDTQITVALVRAMMFQTTFNKNTGGPGSYNIIMEPTVYNAFKSQAALLHTWNTTGVADQPVDMGYQPVGNFEGSPVRSIQSMTVGDVFYVRPEDVHIKQHRSLTMTPVPSGRDSIKVIIRTGINAWVENVGKQGMMTNKD